MTAAPSTQSWLARWLPIAALPLLALVLVCSIMLLVITPRAEQFAAYWYSMPEQSAVTETALALQHSRTQDFLHRAWIIGAAPVALLLLLELIQTLLTQNVFTQKLLMRKSITTGKASPAADQTLIHDNQTGAIQYTSSSDTEKTQTYEFSPQNSGLSDLYIGPNKRYRVERLLASGGMGSVHKGYDTSLQRAVAIKELDVGLSNDEEQKGRFRQEAHALAGLSHPYIVPVYDLLEDNNRFWIVMELLEGGDLEKLITRNRPDIKTASSIIRCIAEALAFAHNKGMLHRDIKPMNILLNSEGIPKLVDFGIAKLAQSQHSVVQTREGLSLGSPTYMSPEQAAGKKIIDKRADIYALGITFYKTLTGEAPFTGDVSEVMAQHITQAPKPPCDINAKISENLNAIVLKMLAKNPDDRYQSLEEFIVAIDAIKHD
jgi:serine/threonine protein kinase